MVVTYLHLLKGIYSDGITRFEEPMTQGDRAQEMGMRHDPLNGFVRTIEAGRIDLLINLPVLRHHFT